MVVHPEQPPRPVTKPARRADPSARRRSAVYGIPTLAVDAAGHPIPGVVIVGYIGKTVQTVKQRENQHRPYQPFGDLIVGGSWAIEEGFWTEAELDAREQWWIRNGAVLVPGQEPQRPVYNYEYNLDNPARIEVWRAVEHRQAREPGWVQPAKGTPIPVQRGPQSYPRPAVRPVRRRRRFRWTRARRRFAQWVVVWTMIALLVVACAAQSPQVSVADSLLAGPVVASMVCGWFLLVRPKRRRRSTRRTYRRRR